MYIYIVCGGIICFVIAVIMLVSNHNNKQSEVDNFDDLIAAYSEEEIKKIEEDYYEEMAADKNTIILNEIADQLKKIVEMNNQEEKKETEIEEKQILTNKDSSYKNQENSQELVNEQAESTCDIDAILRYYKEGMSIIDIAKTTGKGIREIQIMLKLKNLK
ncbi:hypothetical protein PV797_08550 [Clostridiaceae bacterium M8S5]|nr:hypothetical protein PV797_08550 [Clostridiaceae bacterium M8S5]